MSKLPISNNKLLEKYYDSYDVSDFNEPWEFDEPDEVEVCEICSEGIIYNRGKMLAHLYENHKEQIKKDLIEQGA